MEAFYSIYRQLLGEEAKKKIVRGLESEIDYSQRLIGIRGGRGVGKTSLLLSIAANKCKRSGRKCLYVNLNHLYFVNRTLLDFGREFAMAGGKMLLLDQIFKYPNWDQEIAELMDKHPELQIIFTTTAAAEPLRDLKPIAGIVNEYELLGFSLREYLNYKHQLQLPVYTLEEVLEHHEDIAQEVLSQTNVLSGFDEYLKRGYYPFAAEGQHYYEEVVKYVNLTLEIDIVYQNQIEPGKLSKLRKLLYLTAINPGELPNTTALSEEIGISRPTTNNYFRMMHRSNLINMVRKEGSSATKKIGVTYPQNSNLLQVLYPQIPSRIMERKVFFLSQLLHLHQIEIPLRTTVPDFLVNGIPVCICGSELQKCKKNIYYAVDYTAIGKGKRIPLWLFGFLY